MERVRATHVTSSSFSHFPICGAMESDSDDDVREKKSQSGANSDREYALPSLPSETMDPHSSNCDVSVTSGSSGSLPDLVPDAILRPEGGRSHQPSVQDRE